MNMNAQEWDDHVSFSATHLALSPNGKMLAVSTDGPRIVIYRIEGATAPPSAINLHYALGSLD